MSNARKIVMERTNSGLSVIWVDTESVASNKVTVGAKSNGDKPTSVFTRRKSLASGGSRALIVLGEGDYLVHACIRQDGSVWLQIEQALFIATGKVSGSWRAAAQLATINSFDRGEWDYPLPEHLQPAVKSAFRKVSSYYLREVVYNDTSER